MIWNAFYNDAPRIAYSVEIIPISGSPIKWVYEKIEEGHFGSANVSVGIGQCASDPEGCEMEEMTPEDSRWASLTKNDENVRQVIIPLQGSIKGQTPRGAA